MSSTVAFKAILEIRNLTDRAVDVVFEPFLIWWPEKQAGLVLRDKVRKESVRWTLQPGEIRKDEIKREASPLGPRVEGPCRFLVRAQAGGESSTLCVEGWFALSF